MPRTDYTRAYLRNSTGRRPTALGASKQRRTAAKVLAVAGARRDISQSAGGQADRHLGRTRLAMTR